MFDSISKRLFKYQIFAFVLWAVCLLMGSPVSPQEIQGKAEIKKKYDISLKSRKFTPQEGIEAKILSKLQTLIGVEKKVPHVMIQFKEIPTRIERENLNAEGIKVLSYIGGNAWYASVSNEIVLRFREAEVLAKYPSFKLIRWIGDILPEDKISPRIREREVGDWARTEDGKVELVAKYYKDMMSEKAKERLEALGAFVIGEIPAVNEIIISLAEDRIQDLAGEDSICWIEPVPPPGQAESDRVRAHVQVDLAQLSGLSGDGVAVGVFDGGHVSNTHLDFSGRVTKGDSDPWDRAQHPTMTGGLIAGDGSQSASHGGGVNQWRGMAPDADIFTYDFSIGANPSDAAQHTNFIGDLETSVNTNEISIANNSWGTFGCVDFPYGEYEGLCDDLDSAVRGDSYDKPVIVVFSAGNERDGYWDGAANNTGCLTDLAAPFNNYSTMNHPKSAKNIIAVGAIDSFNNRMSGYSSWGPTADGRIKPEIVASGHHNGTPTSGVTIIDNPFGTPVGSANQQDYRTPNHPTTDFTYAWFAQTSSAAASTSGSIALLLEEYREEMRTEIDPLPSTVKALLIHTAEDLDDATTWYNEGPDYASGYGLLQINDAINLIGTGQILEGKVNTGESDIYSINVPAGTASVRITLVWDDPPSTAGAAFDLVNDLDLIVRDSGGTRYYPWTLDHVNPDNPAIRTDADHINNMEQVLVDVGLTGGPLPSGEWEIVVEAFSVPEPPQRYSLVASLPLVGKVDVMQVLDRSGSMGGSASPAMPDTKIEVLRDAAKLFIDIMQADIGNRLGLVQFNQDVVSFPVGADEALSELTSSRVTTLKDDAVDSITDGGRTSIGDGLREALNQLTSVPLPADEHDRRILLVTDGKENEPEWISGVQPDLIDNSVAVFPLGLGYDSGINEAKLNDIAEATGGTYRITSDHLVFRKFFIEVLAAAVNWAETIDPIGELKQGESILVPVPIAADEEGITIAVYWEDIDNAIDVKLITPSGDEITPETSNRWIRYGDHPHYSFYKLDFPLGGDLGGEWAGVWNAKLTGTGQIGRAKRIRYSISVFAEGGAQLDVSLGRLSSLTGDSVLLKAQLTRSGMLLTGAKIDVYGDVPIAGFGNVMHQGAVSLKDLKKDLATNSDPVSLIDQKLRILRDLAGGEVLLREESGFQLFDDGLHGDGQANDGVYANSFVDTKVQGSYNFRFVASDIPAGGGLTTTREWTKALYAEVSIDPDHSDISIKRLGTTADGNKYYASVVPRDRFGNYLGPGHDVVAAVVVPGAERKVQLVDNINGIYDKEVFLTLDEIKKNAKVRIYVDGKVFATVSPPPPYRWSASLHSGTAVPISAFADDFDPGMNVILDLGYRFTPQWQLVGMLGYNAFKAKAVNIEDTNWIHLSANVKYRTRQDAISPYINGGPGYYFPKTGSSGIGFNLGAGVNYDANDALTLEIGVDYHIVLGKDIQFLHAHAGIIFRF